MKVILSFLAGFLLAIGFSGRAVEFYVEGGQCHFEDTGGAFFSQDLPHRNYMTPRCGSIGIQDRFKEADGRKGPWGWKIAYVESDEIQGRDNVARVVDGSHETGLSCDPTTGSWLGCHAVYNGYGYMYGLSFAITREFEPISKVKIIPEGGLLFFRSVYRVAITPLDYPQQPGEPSVIYGVQDSGWRASPAPFAGLMLRYGPVYVGGRYHWASGHRALSLTTHAFSQFIIGVVLEQ